MINNINLTEIKSFVLVARLGSFTKAADELLISRALISKQISALEEDMGVTLLLRTTRRLSLTQAGTDFYDKCQKALTQIDQALVAALDDTQEIKGLIRANCVDGYMGESIISRYVIDFMTQYPEIHFHLDFSSHHVDLIQDEFDIAFRMGNLEDAGYVAQKLIDIDMLTLASPDYIKKYGNLEHPKELNQHRCLTGSVKRWSFESKKNKERIDVNIEGQFVCKNDQTLLNGALAGAGIIRVPKMYCTKEIEAGKLIEILPKWHIAQVPFSLIYHKDKYQPRRFRLFIAYLKKRIIQDFC